MSGAWEIGNLLDDILVVNEPVLALTLRVLRRCTEPREVQMGGSTRIRFPLADKSTKSSCSQSLPESPTRNLLSETMTY